MVMIKLMMAPPSRRTSTLRPLRHVARTRKASAFRLPRETQEQEQHSAGTSPPLNWGLEPSPLRLLHISRVRETTTRCDDGDDGLDQRVTPSLLVVVDTPSTGCWLGTSTTTVRVPLHSARWYASRVSLQVGTQPPLAHTHRGAAGLLPGSRYLLRDTGSPSHCYAPVPAVLRK